MNAEQQKQAHVIWGAGRAAAPAPHRREPRPRNFCQLVATEMVNRRSASQIADFAMRIRRREYRLPISACFSIADASLPAPAIEWRPSELGALFAARETSCAIYGPLRARASLTVDLYERNADAAILDGWDHVAEFALDLPSGRLRVLEGVVSNPPVLTVEYPRAHRVRLSIGNIADVWHEGAHEADNQYDRFVRYRLEVWPCNSAGSVVLKRWKDPFAMTLPGWLVSASSDDIQPPGG